MRDLWTRFTAFFFAHFFYLLFLALTGCQWVLLCWFVFHPWIDRLWIHPLGVVAVYYLNRHMAQGVRRFGRKPQANGPLIRIYFAAAFGSFFGVVYLLMVGAAWAASSVISETIGVSPATSSQVSDGFIAIANGGLAAIALSLCYGYTIGQKRVKVRRVKLSLRRLPSELNGLRIVQISDIHIGQNLTRRELATFVSRVNEQKPDIICITGDIADGPPADVDDNFPILAQLRAKHAVFAILGNHDHYCGANRVLEALARHTTFTTLRDRAVELRIGASTLHVIGLDDRGRDWARGIEETPELDRLVQPLPAGEPVLLLSHRPDIFKQAAALGIDLTLSGHTHGGQIGIPLPRGKAINPAQLTTPFDRGLYERARCFLYVNSGLGVTGQRLRLATPREITVLELTSSQSQ